MTEKRIPHLQRNQFEARAVPDEIVGKILAVHGWEIGVLFYYKDGAEGGHGVTCAGLGIRNGRIAQEFMRQITEYMQQADPESKAVKETLDKELADAKNEMGEGPQGGDPDAGKKLIMPAIERTRADHITERGPTGKAKKAWDRLGASGGKKIKN